MTDNLLYRCVDKYNKALKVCRDFEDRPEPPSSLIIYMVKGRRHGKFFTPVKRLCAWRYSDGELFEIPLEAKQVTQPENEFFYREAKAEFGISRLRKKAYINVYLGKRFAIGFEYDIGVAGMDYMVGNEKILWKQKEQG